MLRLEIGEDNEEGKIIKMLKIEKEENISGEEDLGFSRLKTESAAYSR